MQHSTRTRLGRAATIGVLAATAAFIAGCASQQAKPVASNKRSKEYFAESEYGVKASPRVTTKMSGLQRGGGRDQTGKPYKVRGKWYYPKEDKNYAAVGAASWYGDAFHGRLTANGEVYDMTHLTAAHPTMPLPSYARVTNTKNGSSVIVRINDRGPYSDGRVIDLSKRAAEMLDYAHSGTANVKVEYVGRAPLDGQDDQYLLASYRPGKGMGDPTNIGLPTGVMIAMNGPTPSAAVGEATAFPGALNDVAPATQVAALDASAPVHTLAAQAAQFGRPVAQDQGVVTVVLPDFGPIAPERPDGMAPVPQTRMALATLGYASERVSGAAQAFEALKGQAMSSSDIVDSWKRLNPGPRAGQTDEAYVAAGTFDDGEEATRVAKALSAYGRAAVERSDYQGKTWYSVDLYPHGGVSLDTVLKAAWSHGAPDAFAVHD